MKYVASYMSKRLGNSAGFDAVLHETNERLSVRWSIGSFRAQKRIVWRDGSNEPYVRFDGQFYHIEFRPSYSAGCKVWVVDQQRSPIAPDMTWESSD